MAYDIYGNCLRPGHCEVHPEVPELFPCYRCIEEGREREYVSEPPEPTAEDYCVTVDKIMYDALLAALPVLLSGYFSSVPKEIEEAALIDGCSRIQSITRVLLPVAMPGVITTVIYTFITAWNEFMFALTFITSMDKRPLTLGLYNFVGRWTVQWQYLMAAAILALIPVVILFMFIEKDLVKGLAGGAVKG